MNHEWAFLFPGQGAQYVGMAQDFYEEFSLARQTFDEADDLLSMHLSRLILKGPSEELTLTKNSQLAIFVVSMALLRVLEQQLPTLRPSVCAGLSLGEYVALVASQRITFEDGLKLVQARALFMHQACESIEGTMRVVLGLDSEDVEQKIATLQSQHQVWVANLNCPGQVVIAGTLPAIEAASLALKDLGAKRILPLDVSGAFHSGMMAEAREKLTPYIEKMTIQESQIALVMNVTGDYVGSLDMIRENLISQVTNTVRWEKSIRAMRAAEIAYFLEIGCGKTLTGMIKKIGIPPENSLSLEKVADLDALAKTLEVVCHS